MDLVELINDLESRCFGSALYAWSHGLKVCKQMPTFAYISLSNLCNYRCAMCGHNTMMRIDRGLMNFGLFKKIIAQLPASINRVWLMKQGESLLHREFPKFVKYLKDKRPEIEIQLATNGSALTPENSEAIIKYGDYLDIGVHSINPDTYGAITGTSPERWHKVIRNIKFLDRLKAQRSSDLVYNLTYVRQPKNRYEDDDEIFEFFRNTFPSANKIVMKWEQNFQGEIAEANLEIYDRLPLKKFPRCILPFTSVAILYDGKVSYCPAEARENYFVGDINCGHLNHIWNGSKMRQFRKLYISSKFEELSVKGIYCRECTWPWSFETQNPQLFVSKENINYLHILTELEYNKIEDFLIGGLIYYLNSNMAEACKNFTIASLIDSRKSIIHRKADQWFKEAKEVLKLRYRNTECWEENFIKEGKSLTDFRRKIENV